MCEPNLLRKDAIEEMKIVQDILLKQEAYSHEAFRFSFLIIAGLMIALYSGKVLLSTGTFLILSALAFFGFCYVQFTYREAYYKGLDRSHYLQRYIGSRILDTDQNYEPFKIYENLHHPSVTAETLIRDLKNPRFLLPNSLLLFLVIAAAYWK